jgi:cellobiose phosphorylase
LNGLQIDPVIPADWEGFSAQRIYRGVTYDIRVTRSSPGNQVRITVNGEELEGTVLPLPVEGNHQVTVDVVVGE